MIISCNHAIRKKSAKSKQHYIRKQRKYNYLSDGIVIVRKTFLVNGIGDVIDFCSLTQAQYPSCSSQLITD
jgi:hypothetical protein